MCCLFGLVNYSGMRNPVIDELVNNLAQEATARGMDSTGIAYNKGGKLVIYKKPKNAYELDFKGLEDCVCVSGHTRHATQGSYLKNYNNHPFMGKCKNMKFALSHNGVLWNDKILRNRFDIPKDRIETDSYIAVQLLEHFGELSVENVRRMAESVNGSFTFTITDSRDTLWIVKGDSPLSIMHFPALELYVYASTPQILFTAVSRTDLVDDVSTGDFEMLTVKNGDIIQIDKRGNVVVNRFDFDMYGYQWYNWRDYSVDDTPTNTNRETAWWETRFNSEWLEDIKTVARSRGISDDIVDELYHDGYSLDDIEDFIYSA